MKDEDDIRRKIADETVTKIKHIIIDRRVSPIIEGGIKGLEEHNRKIDQAISDLIYEALGEFAEIEFERTH